MVLRNRSESRHRDTAFEGQHHDLPSPSPMYSQTLTRHRTSGTSWKPPLLTSTGCREHVSSSCIVHRRSMPCHRSPRRGFATFTPTHLHAAETGSNLSFAAYSRTHCSRLLYPYGRKLVVQYAIASEHVPWRQPVGAAHVPTWPLLRRDGCCMTPRPDVRHVGDARDTRFAIVDGVYSLATAFPATR